MGEEIYALEEENGKLREEVERVRDEKGGKGEVGCAVWGT